MTRNSSLDTNAEREIRLSPLITELRNLLEFPPTEPLAKELALIDLKLELTKLVLDAQLDTALRENQIRWSKYCQEQGIPPTPLDIPNLPESVGL